MSIKIHAEKLAVIDDHKTRKYNLKNSTQSSKVLINKASHLMSSIDVANKIFSKMDLPYMQDVKIGFYSPKKIILQTENDILRAKVKELHPQFLRILKNQKFFSKLEKIDVNIVNKEKIVLEKKPDIETKKQIERLKKSLKY
jgi:hypothetical protein